MAEIYLARITGSDGFTKLVVIKRLLGQMASDPEFVQMFLDEARINARLSHSNIVQVLELGEVAGQYFMAMEYVSGLSVAQVGRLATQRLGEVPQGVACGIVAQACAGLHHAHETNLADGSEMGIIHRDVSPQNLLLTYEGFVKVVDFGIAKAEGRATQTRAGMVKGKFAYMSPEQCSGDAIDRRTDIFALGIILFELCTSRRLFKRGSTFETFEAITRGDVPDPSSVSASVPKAVSAVILKALAKKKEDRFPTAEALQEELELAMRRSGVRGSPMDLSRFLEHNFADQIREQEELIRRIESGELAQSDSELDTDQSQIIAANYAAELIEVEDGPTENEEAGRKPPLPTPPPLVRTLAQENAPIPNLPVSMALPIIDAKHIINDMLAAGQKPPPGVMSSPATVLAGSPPPEPSIVVNEPAPAPIVGAATAGAPVADRGGLASFPPTPLPLSNVTPVPAQPAAAPRQSPLYKLVNLPLAYLLAIGCALALIAALFTALLIL